MPFPITNSRGGSGATWCSGNAESFGKCTMDESMLRYVDDGGFDRLMAFDVTLMDGPDEMVDDTIFGNPFVRKSTGRRLLRTDQMCLIMH